MATRSRIALAVQRRALRSGGTRLGPLWALAYRGIARAAAIYLTWGERDPTVYVRGGFGGRDFLPGLSDVDLVVVLPHDPRAPGLAAERARRRWARLTRLLPAAGLVLDHPRIHDDADLGDLAGASPFTYGLEDRGQTPPRPGGYFGDHASADRTRLLGRPGLFGASADWRLLKGPDRRPPEPVRDAQHRRIAAWLELLYWWRLVFPACINPTGLRAADMCVKFVAEPARIWLWLAHGERASDRTDAIHRALRRLPQEEAALRGALELRRSLPDSPDPPLAAFLPALIRLSARIAQLIGDEIADEGTTEVSLAGADPVTLVAVGGAWQPTDTLAGGREPPLLPLADWRSLAYPMPPDESFAQLGDDPGDPAVLGAAAATQVSGPQPVLQANGLRIQPGRSWLRTRLRAVQCRATDPVSFALAEGNRVAMFPRVRGWSAEDTARRAVAEHRAWLGVAPGSWGGSGSTDADGRALGMLLTAARAALFLESVREGQPQLPLTVTETAWRVAARSSASRTVIEDALERYLDFGLRRRQPPPKTVFAMRKLVRELPSYADERGNTPRTASLP